MSNPTFNKYRSTTIYGALKVRDLTNSSGTTIIETANTDLSGNFLSQGDSTFTKAVTCNALLADIDADNKLTTKEYVDNAVSGGGGSILGTANDWTNTNTFNSYFPTSTLPTNTAITDDSIVNKGMNDTLYPRLANFNTFTGVNFFNDYISQDEITIPSSKINKFIETNFLEGVLFGKGFSQNGNDTNTLDNLTLGGVGSSGLELAYDAGIMQTGLGTNTLDNLTLGNSGITIKDINDDTKITINPTQSTFSGPVTFSGANTFSNANTFSSANTFSNANTFSGANTFSNANTFSGANTFSNANTFSGANTFTGQNTHTNNEYFNSIIDARTSQALPSSFRVVQGDIDNPTLPTISSQEITQTGGISITQATTTPQTQTITYNTDGSIINSYTIPSKFTKNIILNIPIGIRNTGTAVLSGSALSFSIKNLFNSLSAKIYINGVLKTTTTAISILNSNSSQRTTTITYTSTGTKTISINQYFFNISIDLSDYFNNDFYQRNNDGTTYTLTIILSPNITNTLTKISNTGNFTATINTALIANTITSTFSASLGANGTASYSPNQNGSGFVSGSASSAYIDLDNSTGTTYTNNLRANSFNLLPVGMVVQWVTATAPSGWLLCDGTIYNASISTGNPIYQPLYNVILNAFGGTNNSDFQVPDYRGMYLRGTGQNGKVGYTTYTGQALNTQQTDAIQTHSHTINHDHQDGNGPRHKFRIRSDGLSGVGFDIICSFPTNTSFTATGLTVPTHSGSSGNNTGNTANETRPVSYSVNYLIKY